MNKSPMLHDKFGFIPLDSMRLLKVQGVDAKKFLQGQLTCDLETISGNYNSMGAHCNPQGRVIFLFRLFYYQDAYYFFLPRTMVEIALTALQKYAVFFKVQMEIASLPLCGWLGQQPSQAFAFAVPGIVPRYLLMTTHPRAETLATTFNLWKYLDITAGLPQIYPATSEKFLPHDLNLQDIDGISFSKGCYTGQEIIARMQHRGTIKNRLFRATITADVLPVPGSLIYYRDQQELVAGGTIIESCEESDNHYQALVATSERHKQTHLFCLEDGKSEIFFVDE